MTIEQTARDLLKAMESMWLNDFGGYQCSHDDSVDIDAARTKLEEALIAEALYRLGQGRSEQRQQEKNTREEMMADSTQYCCYCGCEVNARFQCCGENHFQTFAQMSADEQDEFFEAELVQRAEDAFVRSEQALRDRSNT
jgi:hypothetical protein